MLFIIVSLFLLFIIDIVAMRWGYDSRDKLESQEWERRCEQVWSKGHLVVHPTKREQALNVTRPSLKRVHALQPYGIQQ